MSNHLTKSEIAFITRMAPHIEAGLSFEDAARAVLADDERLFLAATAKNNIGEAIRAELSEAVYFGCRRAA
jgi:hypothetical protein